MLPHSASLPSHGSRLCLPQVEPLGDRIMLSANIIVEGNPTSDELLVGLVMGQLPILADQLETLKIGAELVANDQFLKVEFLKLTEGFLKLQDAVYDFGDVLIKAESKVNLSDFNFTKTLDRAAADVSEQLSKIEALGFSWGENNPMLPAVQNIATQTMDLVNSLLQVPLGGDDTHAENQLYLKLSDDFNKISQDIIKIGSDDFLARKAGKGQQEYLIIKMEDLIVTSSKLGDADLSKILIGLSNELVGLLDPGDGGGGGDIIL